MTTFNENDVNDVNERKVNRVIVEMIDKINTGNVKPSDLFGMVDEYEGLSAIEKYAVVYQIGLNVGAQQSLMNMLR